MPVLHPRSFRIADAMARRIAEIKGAPTFRFYWPEAERDAAIARLKAFLDANGDRIVPLLPRSNEWKQT